MNTQFDFLEEFIVSLLEKNGISGLTEEQKEQYLPHLISQVHERLAVRLVPLLSGDQLEQFAQLLQEEGVLPEQWKTFWHDNIPSFEEEVLEVLESFASEVDSILSA